MAETQCQFDLLQRVKVPNGDDIVGVVLSRIESIEQPPMYSLGWTGLNGRSQGATFSEAEMRLFNPPPKQSEAALPDIDALARTAAKIFKTRHSWQLVKPARKSKSKKRKQ